MYDTQITTHGKDFSTENAEKVHHHSKFGSLGTPNDLPISHPSP